MFKKFLLLSLLMAILMPWQAKAQETLTVCDGTTTNSYIPIYGSYVDTQGTTSEFIIPATTEGMDALIGGVISQLTFYITNSPATWGSPVIQIYMGEVEGTTLSSLNGPTNFTVVYEGVLSNTQAAMEIELNEPYTYEGGNLLIGTYVKTKSTTYKNTTFSGIQAPSGSSRNNSGSGAGTAREFLPKTTFTYEPASTGGCTKPKQFNASNITAHTATLTWTAGAEGQSNWDVFVTTDATIVPDDNTTPTYQVTECSKDLSGLTAQTNYYVYVRTVCAADDKSKWANKTFVTTREALTVDSNNPYSQDFENSNDWSFENGTLTNTWCWGSAVNNGGEKSIYVSKDGGTTYEYIHSNTAIYVSKLFNFAQGTYTFFFDWNAKGESTYDYLRVALAPGDVEFTAGTSLYTGVGTNALPNGWIALDGGSKLNLSDSWQTQSAEAAVSGTYTMVFIWRNDGSGGTTIPAAIDNISISYMTCPRPTGLTANNIGGRTATLTWTENGTATNWVLQYATNNTFTESLTETNVSGTASTELTGLTPETKYYTRVKSMLGTDESSWSDVKDFTTLATCPKPNLSYVTNSNTAYTGSVSWTGSTADAYEVAYRPKNDFDPSDMTLTDVTRVQLENVSEYTYTLQNLSPETKYYIYIQANCGAEDGVSLWSNRGIFTTLATCLAPSYLTEESVSSNSVTLSWTKGAQDQNAWQFRYRKASTSEYTYVLVENNPSNSYELTGLEPATSYDVNVRAWCGGDDYSKWSLANQSMDKTITTACASITLPYSCDFEGAVETGGNFSSHPIPKCWDREEMQSGNYGNYYYYPYVHSQSSEAHGGTKSLRMYRTPNSANQTIILPAIDDSYNMNDLQIRFWAKAGSSDNTLSVGIMDNGNFTEVQLVEGVSTSYAEFTVPLTSYAGNGRNIAIKCGSSSSYLYYYIDDVTVEVIPSCLIPTGLTNTTVTYNTASFVWQPGKDETEWNIQYKKTSDSEWSNPIHVTELPTTENPFVLTGLQRGIEYEARIQAYCDAEDQSEWNSMPVSFTTDCGVWPIDTENSLFEDFSSSAFPPACWNWIRVSNYYGWQHSSGQYNPLDQQGTAYSYWPTGETYLILPQMHINGAAKLTFDMVFSGDGSGEESSVVLSTTGYGKLDFTNTLWTATEFPKTKTTISLDLSAYNDRDIYIAFKYNGVGTSGRMWYIDNVQVYVGEIFTKDITAYTEGSNDRYYLIASPVGEVNPENVANMLANNYDLYYFDQSKELEWINYEGTDGNFSLIPGKGYLYANSGNVTLRFVGQPYNRDGQISLDKVSGAEFEGWNLIGNPFGTNATLDLPYFRMNADGTALNATTETTAVAPMEGVFVIATTDDQKATFTATRISPKQVPMLNININRNQGTAIDNAIIRFDEGGILPKFQLNPNSTKIYIPENSQDYAIVRSTGSGELPVNFKATRNGRYYISVNAEDVEVNYLHLIDNLTGNDVDLLASGSYEFEAKITDYASRFKLMFNVNEDNLNNQDNFAFYHNGEIIINGQGTLRVFDALGRQLFTKDLSSLTSNLSPLTSPGVYVIQLIQNDKVRTQKIVIP